MQTKAQHLIVYHRADADGWMSNALLRHYLTKSGVTRIVSIGWDFNDPPPDLSAYDPSDCQLWIVDLPIDPVRSWVNRAPENVYWIDHHRTSILDARNIELVNQGKIQGVRYEGISACRLVFAYFEMRLEPEILKSYEAAPFPDEPAMVFLIGLRDVWKHRGTPMFDECNELDLALKSIPRDEIQDALAEYLTAEGPRAAILTDHLVAGRQISGYAKSTAAEAADRGAMVLELFDHPTEDRAMKVLALNTQGRGSAVLDFAAYDLISRGGTIEALMAWAVARDGKVNVSLYHAPGSEHIDLSRMAKAYGGGGHPGACGFTTNIVNVAGWLSRMVE